MDDDSLPAEQNASALSLQEREAHRDWIGGRAVTLLSHYWRHDDPVELASAIGRDWADVLEGLPQQYIQKACIKYQRDEPRRKPTPGAIYQMARELMPRPQPVRRPEMSREESEAYLRSMARDRIDPKRKAEAEKIMRELFPSRREA